MEATSPRRRKQYGPHMAWDEFREEYQSIQLSTLKSPEDVESRLDTAERILKPRRLSDVVRPATDTQPAKYASAHDLRRSLAERMYDAGVPEREVSRVMRHASSETTRRHYAPGNVQKSAGVLREKMSYTEEQVWA